MNRPPVRGNSDRAADVHAHSGDVALDPHLGAFFVCVVTPLPKSNKSIIRFFQGSPVNTCDENSEEKDEHVKFKQKGVNDLGERFRERERVASVAHEGEGGVGLHGNAVWVQTIPVKSLVK